MAMEGISTIQNTTSLKKRKHNEWEEYINITLQAIE
jgi:hypothetical protein